MSENHTFLEGGFYWASPIGGDQVRGQMIVEAIKLLFENNVKVNTLFVGDGDAKEELENLPLTYEFFKK